MLGKTKKLHFVGIGGIGMSGIAELLINYGYKISGSDLLRSHVTERLEKMGAEINYSHKASNVHKDVDVVVKSSAVTSSNIEIKTAVKKNIPVIRRAEMLSELMRMKMGICIAGTHGKTTTTSMTGMILTEAGLLPTLVIGGVVKNFDSNAVLGKSEYIVVEADEYDRSFLSLTPIIAGICNIEEEHVDCYPTVEELENAFLQFANSVPFFGLIVACIDDSAIKRLLPRFDKRLCTFGLDKNATVRSENIKYSNFESEYDLIYANKKLGTINLALPGEYNVQNSLLAASIALELEIPFIDIRNGLQKFNGVYRRFERKGFVNDILVYDDYAHHPTEVRKTLQGIKEGSVRRIVAVFQPHLFTRTNMFYKKFAEALMMSDVLIVNDIYPAREEPIKGVTGKLISDVARELGHKKVYFIKNREDIPAELMKMTKSGDFVITMGAGNIFEVSEKFVQLLEKQNAAQSKKK